MNGRIADDKLKLIADWVLPPISMFESGWDADLYQSHMVRDMARELIYLRRALEDFLQQESGSNLPTSLNTKQEKEKRNDTK